MMDWTWTYSWLWCLAPLLLFAVMGLGCLLIVWRGGHAAGCGRDREGRS